MTFLLGVGAQKAGTTWLHEELSKNANVDVGFTKEYHVHDLLTIPHMRGMLLKNIQAARQIDAEASHSDILAHMQRREFKMLSLFSRPNASYDYFADLLARPGIELTCDITPSYSALSIDTLRQIKTTFERRGIPVKCVFLMRDPVERIWSALRMQRRNKLASMPDKKFKASEDKAVMRIMNTKDAQMRGEYHKTLQRITAVFEPKDLYFGLYETFLKAPAQWQSFCQMTGVTLQQPDYGKHYNATQKGDDLAVDTKRAVVKTYSDVYAYLRAQHPELEIDHHWPSAKLA